MNNVLRNAESSLVKWAVDFAAEHNLEYVELDARLELSDASLPDTDIIGLTQFAITDEDGFFSVHVMFGVSTFGDENLFRLRDLTNALFNRLQTMKTLPYYDADPTTPVLRTTMLVLPGTTLLPTHRVETRPFRFVQVRLSLDPTESTPQA